MSAAFKASGSGRALTDSRSEPRGQLNVILRSYAPGAWQYTSVELMHNIQGAHVEVRLVLSW